MNRMLRNIKSLDIESDNWSIEYSTNLGDRINFDFSFLPNPWFKKIHKQITLENITLKKISIETLNRYSYSFKHFVAFLNQYGIDLNTYEDLTYHHTQMFIFYLKQQNMSNSTRVIILSALKWIITHGQVFEYEGFPKRAIFDGDEYKAVRVEDVLKTKYIPDFVMNQIENSLKQEDNVLLKNLIEIGIDTGIRIGEVLELKKGCITEDFTGKPVLHVKSNKNKTERFIPVSRRVKRAIKSLEKVSEEGREILDTEILAVYWQKINKKYAELKQKVFRDHINRFVKRHNIISENGNLYNLNYHAFRHSLGTEMLNKGMEIDEIADYLGHESLHSAAGYAKLKNPTVQKEYKKLGFIGTIVEEISEEALEKPNLSEKQLKSAALPDGACAKPIDNKGNICANYNMCIICPKFITTPKHLSVHKDHLARLQADREQYMTSEYIGTVDHLNTIENTLETIIERLEEMDSG